VGTSVNNVKRWNGHDKSVSWLSSKVSKMVIEWYTLLSGTSSGRGKRDGQDGVGTKSFLAPSPFVCASIELFNHKLINIFLFDWIHSLECWTNNIVYVVDCFKASFSEVSSGILVSHFKGLINTGRSSTRDSGSEYLTIMENNVGLYSWISS